MEAVMQAKLVSAWLVNTWTAHLQLCLQARWHDSKQPLSLMLPGQKSAVLVLQMLLSDV